MKIGLSISAMLAAALFALAGCGDGFTGPELAHVPENPSYVGLLLPAVQKIEAATQVETSSGEGFTLTLTVTLFDNGNAKGVAHVLVDKGFGFIRDDSNLLWIVSGRTACVGDTPVAYYTGYMKSSWRDERVPFHISVRPSEGGDGGDDVLIGGGGDDVLIEWRWEMTDLAGREAESFVFEARNAYFSPKICNAR